ncbi:MAG: anti-sigma factor antagonist [Comamonadaceae bacterium]|nr:MAG: anti-sigma factor antagonist [Comamonadaceae bacterium]
MYSLPPVLTHQLATAAAASLRDAVRADAASQVVADASALREFDSSALAVLLEGRREALAASKSFAVSGLPPRLRELAGLYGVATLIPEAGLAA